MNTKPYYLTSILAKFLLLCEFSQSFTIQKSRKTGVNDLKYFKHPFSSFQRVNYPIIDTASTTSSSLNAVEYFDGSTVVDPVIVSDVYWNSLGTKVISVIVGQAFAAITFWIILSYFSKQMQNFWNDNASNFISTLLSNPSKGDGNTNSQSESGKVVVEYQNSDSDRNSKVIQPDFNKLLICIVIDLIGTSSELIPVVGEISDVAWSPIAAYALRSLYGGSNVVFLLEFVEEILPFTDILPLATICWFIETFYYDSDIAKLLQINTGDVVSKDDNSIVDVKSEDISSKLSEIDRRNLK